MFWEKYLLSPSYAPENCFNVSPDYSYYALTGFSREYRPDSHTVRSGKKIHNNVWERPAQNSYSQLSSSTWARQKLTGLMSTQTTRRQLFPLTNSESNQSLIFCGERFSQSIIFFPSSMGLPNWNSEGKYETGVLHQSTYHDFNNFECTL